ncbi:unnamed protein product [Amoebophrya sp. A25]|nr:unnamed protein product [Amoebophrya sp. A25]|eukprot:GSA25T00005874001.1
MSGAGVSAGVHPACGSSKLVHLWEAETPEGVKVERTTVPLTQSVRVETCGRGFFAEFETPKVIVEEDILSESTEAAASPSKRQQGTGEPGKKSHFTKAGIFKLDDNLKGVELYKFLQVPEDASEKEITKSFRSLCLVYHPDKVQAGTEEEANKEFLKLQEAYDILLDPIRRRKYDSSRPFDDDIPKEADCEAGLTDDEFFELFDEVFKRNSKWSVKQPVPQLPAFQPELQEDTPEYEKYMQTVQKFYKFWTGDFESWRDFDLRIIEEEGEDALDDPGKAEYREEKRYIERQNARIRQKYRNNESARLLELAERAEKWDSRMRLLRDQAWARKNAGKEARRKEKEERERKEAEEKAAREAAEKAAEEQRKNDKAAKEEEKNALKVVRRDLRQLAKLHAKTVSAEQFQEVLLQLKSRDENEKLLQDLTDELTKMGNLESGITLVPRLCALVREHLSQEPIMVDPPVETPAVNNAAAFAESAPAKQKGNKKNNKKNNKKGGAADENEDAEEDRADAMERVLDAEAEAKRHAESEKKKKALAEKRKQEEAAKKRAEDQARKKEAEKAKKAEAAAAKKAEEERAKNEAMRQKHLEEAARAKAEAEQERMSEVLSKRFGQVREEQLAQYDKTIEDQGIDAVLNQVKTELADGLHEAWVRNMTERAGADSTPESRLEMTLDVQACLVANFTKYRFFEIAVRPTAMMTHLTVANSLRNRMKKLREALRKGLRAQLPCTGHSPNSKQSKKFSNAQMEQILNGVLPEQLWQQADFVDDPATTSKGEPASKAAAPDTAASAEQAAPPASGKAPKKKAKAAKKEEEEDLDAIFAELGIEEKGKKKKGKK